MAVQQGEIAIYGVLVNDTPNDTIAYARQIIDPNYPGDIQNKNQQNINNDLYNRLGSVGGSVDGDFYKKSETYNREEVEGLISSAKQEVYNNTNTVKENLEKEIDEMGDDLMGKIVELHSDLVVTATPAYVEKGSNTQVKFTTSVQYNGQVLDSTITINGGSSKTFNVSNTQTFNIKANVDNSDPVASFEKNKTIVVEAYVPVFIGFSVSGNFTGLEDSLDKLLPISYPLKYTENNVPVDSYLWCFIERDKYREGVEISVNGFKVPIALTTSDYTITSVGTSFYVLRSFNKFNGGDKVTVQIN